MKVNWEKKIIEETGRTKYIAKIKKKGIYVEVEVFPIKRSNWGYAIWAKVPKSAIDLLKEEGHYINKNGVLEIESPDQYEYDEGGYSLSGAKKEALEQVQEIVGLIKKTKKVQQRQ